MAEIFPGIKVETLIAYPLGGGQIGYRPGAPAELIGLAANATEEGERLWDEMLSSGRMDYEQMGFELETLARIAKEYLNGAYVLAPEFVRQSANAVNKTFAQIAWLETGADIYFGGMIEVGEHSAMAYARLGDYWASAEPVWDFIFDVKHSLATIPEKIGETGGDIMKGAGIDPSDIPYAYGVGAGVAAGILGLGLAWYIFRK